MASRILNYPRILKLRLPQRQSAFLWGPRQVGKSTYLKENFPHSQRLDLLDQGLALRLLQRPQELSELITTNSSKKATPPIIIDEVQKIPGLLDEVHRLIEDHNKQFILCGSSARKLKRGQANLLGGRAWRFEMFPLVYPELPKYDLLQALTTGLLPAIYNSTNPRRSLNAYVQDYLKEEVQLEGLVRNLSAFARFLDCAGVMHTQLTNFSNIASDVGVDSKTVKEYFEILSDTLIARFVEPLSTSKRISRKDLVATPKFYLFDPGVARILLKSNISALKGPIAGVLFEGLIAHELFAYRSYKEKDFSINFFRTHSGLEVDFVLESGDIIIETSITERVRGTDLRSINAFRELRPDTLAIFVSNEPRERALENGKILILPWRIFLERLWAEEII